MPSNRMKRVGNAGEAFVIKVPKGEPVKCHFDREGTVNVYVMTKEDLQEQQRQKTQTSSTCDPLVQSSSKADVRSAQYKQLMKELFGEEDEEEVSPPVCMEAKTDQTSSLAAVASSSQPKTVSDRCVTFQDPETTLMDSGNMGNLMPPRMATKMWYFPTRLVAVTDSWSPEKEPEVQPCSSSQADALWCWHDCHPFTGRPFRMPWSKDRKTGTYSVLGYFCSPACARAYNNNWGRCSAGKSRRDTLIIELAVKYYGYSYRSKKNGTAPAYSLFPCAPDKLLLKEFGGPLSIEEFRAYTRSDCEKHLSLEYPYVVVPQIALEKANAPDDAAMNDGGKERLQLADTAAFQHASSDIAPCCKTVSCRTFAEARKSLERQRLKQETITNAEGYQTSELAKVKRAMWLAKNRGPGSYERQRSVKYQESRKRKQTNTTPDTSTAESTSIVTTAQGTLAPERKKRRTNPRGPTQTDRTKKKEVDVQETKPTPASKKPLLEDVLKQTMERITPSSSFHGDARVSVMTPLPKPSTRQPRHMQKAMTGYIPLSDILNKSKNKTVAVH